MNFWNAYWYGPVSTLRPILFLRVFLTMLAFDVWIVRSYLSSAYGLNGFNVAHFSLLDPLQPLPTPELQGAVQFLTGTLALTLAFWGVSRVALGVLCVIYTYGWAMSLLDTYQHHYLMSIILVLMIFSPIEKKEVAAQAGTAERLASWPKADCWSYVLLCVTAANVYLYGAIAKLDTSWLSGDTLWIIDESSGFLISLASVFAYVGISKAVFWPLISVGTIAIELAIAASYLVAVVQDRSERRIIRVVCWTAWALAMSLHTGFILMRLRIGWFSPCMMLLACVAFLPQGLLVRGSYVLLFPFRVFNQLVEWVSDNKLNYSPAVTLMVCLLLTVGLLAGLSLGPTIPGISAAGLIAAGVLVTIALVMYRRGDQAPALRMIMALSIATASLWVTMSVSTVKFRFHEHAAVQWMQVGRHKLAQSEITIAQRESHRLGPAELSKFTMISARVQQSLGRLDEASTNLRHVLSIDPYDAEAHHRLGAVLNKQGRFDEAIDHFQEALRVRPNYINALYDCGDALVQANRPEEATTYCQQVIALQPMHAGAHNMLGIILAQQGRLREAAERFERAVEIAPDYVGARQNLRRATKLLQKPQ